MLGKERVLMGLLLYTLPPSCAAWGLAQQAWRRVMGTGTQGGIDCSQVACWDDS